MFTCVGEVRNTESTKDVANKSARDGHTPHTTAKTPTTKNENRFDKQSHVRTATQPCTIGQEWELRSREGILEEWRPCDAQSHVWHQIFIEGLGGAHGVYGIDANQTCS